MKIVWILCAVLILGNFSYAQHKRTIITGPPTADLTEKQKETKRIAAIKRDLTKKMTLLQTKNPLFVVDGILLESLKTVDTASIDTVILVRPKLALTRYGTAGKKGALEITLLKETTIGKKIADESVMVGHSQIKGPPKDFTDTPWPSSPPEYRGPVMEPESEKIYTKTEIEPKYKLDWLDWVKKNLKYPEDALDDGLQGKVIIRFIVKTDGSIYDLRVDPESPVKNPSLVREAIRILLKTNGQWKPAMQNGKEVNAYAQKEIHFNLADEE